MSIINSDRSLWICWLCLNYDILQKKKILNETRVSLRFNFLSSFFVFLPAFTHRSPKEAGPCHFRDCRFLGAAVMAGHRYFFSVCAGNWLVNIINFFFIKADKYLEETCKTKPLSNMCPYLKCNVQTLRY